MNRIFRYADETDREVEFDLNDPDHVFNENDSEDGEEEQNTITSFFYYIQIVYNYIFNINNDRNIK